jgi:hypothetical protein
MAGQAEVLVPRGLATALATCNPLIFRARAAVPLLHPSRPMRPLLGLLTLAAVACAGQDPGADPPAGGEDGKEDRTGAPAFFEVDPGHSSASFRRYIGHALELLRTHESRVARLTYASIRDGRVRVDELADLTCWDFERARVELAGGLESADHARLRDPGGDVLAVIEEQIDGYMWGDRVYVARGLDATRLAATLIHEVNHVINRSDVGYFDDLPVSAFRHEYRAFHAERLFDPETYEGIDLTEMVLELYELDGEALPESVRRTPLTPRLLPDAEAWRQRRVEDDPVDRDEDCPGLL